MTHDILIRGGLLLDGTGAAGRLGDLAIRDGRIVAMGADLGEDATKLIDATGLAVAPGFIDIKTHSDFTLPINPKAESKVRQGVTTEIIGHCGFSVAPALPGKVELLRDYLSPSAPWLPFKETTFPAYLDDFPATAVNAGMLVGHNTLRLMVMGMADRPPTPDELAQMIALLEDALDAGALGLSSGLFTAPARRIEQGARRARGSHRDRRSVRRACRDRALQVLGNRQLGQGRASTRHDRGRQGTRARCRLRLLPLRRRQQPAQEPDAAMGAGGWRRGHAGAARGEADARAHPKRY
jgi:N-acyl-D-aspartate/D-glutamate deacylase